MFEKDLEKAYYKRLLEEYSYPESSIKNEVAYSFGKARYTLDIVVTRENKPYIVIEIKASVGHITKDQLLKYAQAAGAEYVVASDGLMDDCYRVIKDNYQTYLEKIPDIPPYGKTLEQIGFHSNEGLVGMSSAQLTDTLWKLADIYRGQGLATEEALRDILKILLLKAYDETLESPLFRAKFKEEPENVQTRINALATKASDQYPRILKEPLIIKTELLVKIVQILQKYSIKESAKDLTGSKLPIAEMLGPKSYLQAVPKDVIKLIVGVLEIKTGEKFIDPACGVGGLLAEVAKAGAKVIGVEKNNGSAQFAEATLALSGLKGEIQVFDPIGSNEENLFDRIWQSCFDCAAVVPPFGMRISYKRLNNFKLGKSRIAQSAEALYMEKTLQWLKLGGRLVMVIPESFMFADSMIEARNFMLKKAKVKAIISLPSGAFKPFSGAKTSLLALESDENGASLTDEVFVAVAESVEEFDSIVNQFRSLKHGQLLKFGRNVAIVNINSARQMTAEYLLGESLEPQELNEGLVASEGTKNAKLLELVNFTTGTPLTTVGKEDPSGKVYYLRAGDVGEFIVNLNKSLRLNPEKDYRKYTAEPGDILMTRAGTVGRVALVSENCPPMIVGANVTKMAIKDRQVLLPEYLLGFLSSKQGEKQIKLYAGGATIRAISVSGLMQVKVPLLPLPTQRKMATQVRKIIQGKLEATQVLKELEQKEKKMREELERLTNTG